MVTGLRLSPQDALSKAFDQYLNEAGHLRPIQLSTGAKNYPPEQYGRFAENQSTELAPLYQMQQVLRPMFGKAGNKSPAIGDHPDFEHLKGTDDTEFCPVTTMFMDIEESTRLGLLFPLEQVFRIKNAFIRAAIEVITSFDGHVHRIMGDAVMAYFGGCKSRAECAAIDGLNCAAVLRALVERVVVPRLNKIRTDHEFGIRIGLDYGPKESVLWSCYGYPMSEEVTATSFFVDVASKLQHAASRNKIMIGESLRAFVDLPDEFLSVKKVIREGREVEVLFVIPNHTGTDGCSINYRQHIFDGDRYLSVGPVIHRSPKLLGDIGVATQVIPVTAEVFAAKYGLSEGSYVACTGPVAKEKWIRFKPHLPFLPRLPYTVRCSVENHGKEAVEKGGANRGDHSTPYTIKSKEEHDKFRHWEPTAYRGLHFMIIDVNCHAGRYRTRFGVYIE